ncbi:hypothetical protein E4P39_10785 [Blastococcus sp. CT_GayMR19]|uniref:SSI family serine proteinase inhibitor n=1 Tax=Blastococcus sp. CT_GayMR19 TaxID=2559608 RepID=UPI0010747D63|nr:SSI family serine proteinase inhibitor [Blastococcus sp. CT_GayMR19]TFV75514.1 hypothetical protein E4P39_10785 [Blastococcus sp. CT_GayMR19]
MRILLALVALLTLLTACASPSGDAGGAGDRPATSGSDDPAAGGGIEQADNDLQVEFDPGDGTEPETWTLTCVGFVEGSHPDAEAACAHLKATAEPFAPLPADVVCTEQYGGAQTARVLGRWNGEPVDLELSRTDGCRISQWDALGPLLPGPVG